MAGKLRQKHTFLRCRIATADNKNFFACKELAVTGGAVGNTSTFVFFLSLKPNRSWMRAGCQQDTKAAVVALTGMHSLDIPVQVKAGSFRKHKLRAETFCLLLDGIRQGFAAGLGNAGVIHHFVGNGNLAAELFFFQHQHPVFGPGKVQRGGQPRRTAADNHDIVQILHQS